MVRVPNRPLSITAEVSWTSMSVIWVLLVMRVTSRSGRGIAVRTRPVFDRSPLGFVYQEATTEDRRTVVPCAARASLVFVVNYTEGERPRWSLPLGTHHLRRPSRPMRAR